MVELETEAREARDALTIQLEALAGEKSTVAEELAKAAEREKELLAQHEARTSELTQQLEIGRQQYSEREKALLENIGRLKEESQSAGQTVSEEAEKLKKTIATMNEDHESALNIQQQTISRSLAENDSKLADTLRAAEAETQTSLEALKEDYEAKLTDARQKQTKAVEIVKKLKAATATKLQGAHKALADEKAAFEQEKSDLESKLKSEYEACATELSQEHATLMKEWDAKLSAKDKEHEDSLLSARNEREKEREQLSQEHNMKVSSLQEALDAASSQLQDASTTKETERQLEAKLKEAQEQHQKQLEEMADTHANELKKERLAAQEQVQQLKTQQEETAAKLAAEKENVFEASKQELELRLQELSTKHAEEMNSLQERMATHSDDLKRHFKEKVQVTENKLVEETKSFGEQLTAKEAQLVNIVRQMNEKNTALTTLERQHEALQTKFSSDVVVKQALQKKMDELQKQLAQSVANSSTATQSLLQEQEKVEREKIALEETLRNTVQERDANKNKVEELMGKLEALGSNLNITLDEQNILRSELESASKKAAKLDTTESELNSLRDQINKLKLEQTKSNSLLEKLQAEKEANSRNHGQRTALVGMLEEQLADLNDKNSEINAKFEAAKYDLSARDEDMQSLQEQLLNAQKSVTDTQNSRRQASDSLSSAQKGADAKKSKMIDTLQREVQSLQQQMAKKSAAAQKLIQQREFECIELRKTTKTLQQEVDKGSLSDRRIFELAAQQSNRESAAASEIDVRDKIVDKLTGKLVVQDGDLAKAEYSVKSFENQVEELCRIRRREDVNLDYLKSIVVQYLSKPPGASEREALLPVLATLLQFDANDYKVIEDGKSRLSWWGSVAPIVIAPPTQAPVPQEQAAPLLSAEVSVSRTTSADAAAPLNNGRSRTTSMEF